MVPPIYQCEAGHCVCSKCSETTKICPTCQRNFQTTQNFTLSQVIMHMTYPCQYEACKYSCKSKEIKKHEASCDFRPITCPMDEYLGCKGYIISSQLGEHLLVDHRDLVLESEEILCSIKDDMKSYILTYKDEIFILDFEMVHPLTENGQFIWEMNSIGTTNKKGHTYAIDIVDKSGKNRRIYMKGMCKHTDGDILYVSYKQIQEFLVKKNILFRVEIMEEKTC